MILKLFSLMAMLSLVACSNENQTNESEQARETEETIIELEDTENVEETMNFNKNNSIASNIYREHFYPKELLDEGRMESDLVGVNKVLHGKKLPPSTEIFPESYYMNYTYNTNEEKLGLALILTEGSVVKEEELLENTFIYLEYDNELDTLLNVTQENEDGVEVENANLNEEEWKEVANRYIGFVNSIN